jgi:hypothetical protein
MGTFVEDIVTTDTLGRRTGPRTRHSIEEKLRIVQETRASPHVACAKGCSACCHMNVTVSTLEAKRIESVTGRRATALTQTPGIDPRSSVVCPVRF